MPRVDAIEFPRKENIEVSDEEFERILLLAEEGGVETLTDEEYAILESRMEEEPLNPDEHDANLAEFIDESELGKIASDVLEWFQWDDESREDWKEREKKGIMLLGVSENTEGGANFEGASRVVHPLLAEACVQFQARAIAELWPAEGPVKTQVMGETNEELSNQSHRVHGYMNYLYTQEMPGAFEEEDQLLMRLPMSGSCFVKNYNDSLHGGLVRRFIDPNYFVVPYSATDLQTAPRYTEVILESANVIRKKMYGGEYRKISLNPAYEDKEDTSGTQVVQDEIDATEGRERVSVADDQRHTNLEMHVDYDLKGFEDKDEKGRNTGIALPYIITLNKDNQKVLSIRRNWREEDPRRKKRVYYTHRKFLPGLGFYGYGFLHIIGGLSRASTGALRALLDAAQFSNLPGGFRTKEAKMPDGNITIAPGEWPEVETTAEDINKAFFKLPFGEPSEALFKLLGYLSEIGQRFASTTENMIGEAKNTGPVGTTLALIEQGSKVFSAIHKRQHEGFAKEFKLVAELCSENLPDEYPYDVPGESRVVKRQDFDDRVDVIPVSDPNIVSGTQRIAQAQSVYQLSKDDPDLYDRRKVHERMLNALRVQGVDELMPDQSQVPHMGPVEENMAMTTAQPVKAYLDQDHQAHIMVHAAWFESLSNLMKERLEPSYIAHQAEHEAFDYFLKIQSLLGREVPITPYGEEQEEQPPEVENEIAMAAAQASQLMRQQSKPDPDEERKNNMVEADIERKDKVAEADISRKDAIAQADIERKEMQVINDLNREQE